MSRKDKAYLAIVFALVAAFFVWRLAYLNKAERDAPPTTTIGYTMDGARIVRTAGGELALER